MKRISCANVAHENSPHDDSYKSTKIYYRFIIEYTVLFCAHSLEVSSPDRAVVKLPRTDSYFYSFPAGSVSKADHIARVTVGIPAEVTASTPIPYYAALESYHGMEIPNPATIRLNPAVALLGIKPNGFDNIAYIVVSGNNDDDVLSGTFTYVPNLDDLMYSLLLSLRVNILTDLP